MSPWQRRWACWSARWHGVSDATEFRCEDAEELVLEPASFDVIWSIECTEHLYDKPAFFRQAAQWLKPDGRMAICAWLAAERLQKVEQVQQVVDVCEGFLCPSLGSAIDYRHWMEEAGMEVQQTLDWTERVARTWEICIRRVQRTGMRRLARWIDANTFLFLDRFHTLLEAYRCGAMQYGCLVARKPHAAPTPAASVSLE